MKLIVFCQENKMALSEIDKELIKELKRLSDNHDFIVGVMSIAKRQRDRKDILRFINRAAQEVDAVKQDDIVALAITLKNRGK